MVATNGGLDGRAKLKLVSGYHACTPIPPDAQGHALRERLAVVLDSYRPDSVDWVFDFEFFAALLRRVCEELKCDQLAVTFESEQPAQPMALEPLLARMEDTPPEDLEPPRAIGFLQAERLICLESTEFWTLHGGPAPYHDSYTFAFYSGPETHVRITRACQQAAADVGATIEETIVGLHATSFPRD